MKKLILIIGLILFVACDYEPRRSNYQHDVTVAVLYTDLTRDTIYHSYSCYSSDIRRSVFIRVEGGKQVLSIGWTYSPAFNLAWNVRSFQVLKYNIK